MTSLSPRLAAVYLARAADGIDAFTRFAASYARHPAGIAHDLVVLYKGFAAGAQQAEARRIFETIPHQGIELDDTGFDIGSYVEASRRLDHDALCFLNTHSEILAPDWLALLAAPHRRGVAGLVGAMGSFESIAHSVPLLERAIRTAQHPGAAPPAALPNYFDFVLPRFRPDWYGAAPGPARRPALFAGWRAARARARDHRRGPRGTALIWPSAPELDLAAFPPFPNPHVRSNAFLIARTRLLDADLAVIRSKQDANLFESGHRSLTAQLRAAGLATLVAGRDGAVYDVPDWPLSRTFRLHDQANLLVGDNHTRAFAAMSGPARVTHARMTWGDYLGPAPPGFPTLGIDFPRGRAVAPTLTAQHAPSPIPEPAS